MENMAIKSSTEWPQTFIVFYIQFESSHLIFTLIHHHYVQLTDYYWLFCLFGNGFIMHHWSVDFYSHFFLPERCLFIHLLLLCLFIHLLLSYHITFILFFFCSLWSQIFWWHRFFIRFLELHFIIFMLAFNLWA